MKKEEKNNLQTIPKNGGKECLLDRVIAEALKTKAHGVGQVNRNMALFLANQHEIETTLNAGWNVKIVWKVLYESGVFPATYDCFRRYVKRFITDKQQENSTPPVSLAEQKIAPKEEQLPEKQQEPVPQKTQWESTVFKRTREFDPKSTY